MLTSVQLWKYNKIGTDRFEAPTQPEQVHPLIAVMFQTLFPAQMAGTRNINARLQVVTVVSGNSLYIISFFFIEDFIEMTFTTCNIRIDVCLGADWLNHRT